MALLEHEELVPQCLTLTETTGEKRGTGAGQHAEESVEKQAP
jgi:hypothetical protein